jgi:hypothetical protein
MRAHVFTPPERTALLKVGENIAALDEPVRSAVHECGQDVADTLRVEYPELPDTTLGHLLANIAAYADAFRKQNPGLGVGDFGAVIAQAAIDLANLALELAPARREAGLADGGPGPEL